MPYFSTHAQWMEEKRPEDAVLVIPHSNMFSTRNSATEATKNAVRAMEYHCRIGLRSVSEYTVQSLSTPPRLLIFPSPSVIDRDAWDRLIALVQSGSTLLVTGPIDQDRYLLPVGRSAALGIRGTTVGVGAEEHLTIDGREYRLGYRGEKMQRIEKFVADGEAAASLFVVPSGKGSIIWSPLLVEVSDSMEARTSSVAWAGGLARGHCRDGRPSVPVRTIRYRDALMVTFVSDAAAPVMISGTLAQSGTTFTVEVPPRRTVVNLYRRREGTLIASLNPSLADTL